MEKLSTRKVNPILKLKKGEYKYLSPNVSKTNKKYILFFCNRKNIKNFYGEINIAISKNLYNWKKKLYPILKPKKKHGYRSYISPYFYKHKNKNYLFVEAQKKNGSDILCFTSKNVKRWSIYNNFKLRKKNNSFQSPCIYKINNKINLYYSYNKKKINCLVLNSKLKKIKNINCLKSTLPNEKFSIYSPSLIKINNFYYMFYAAWKNDKTGNINCAYSKDGISWKKFKQNLFNIQKPVKIVSEPHVIIKDSTLLIFFEYKKNNLWNISCRKIKYDYKKNTF